MASEAESPRCLTISSVISSSVPYEAENVRTLWQTASTISAAAQSVRTHDLQHAVGTELLAVGGTRFQHAVGGQQEQVTRTEANRAGWGEISSDAIPNG